MYIVRNVFHAKPGSAMALAEAFKRAAPHMEKSGVSKNTRVMTDTAASFWTVVVESEVENLNEYLDMSKAMREMGEVPEMKALQEAYTNAAHGGHREIFKIV